MTVPDAEQKFLCDRMAGSLCKYLRFMGYDSTSANDLPPGNPREDTLLLEAARREGRYILTRDAELAERGGTYAIYLRASDIAGQIMQLAGAGIIVPDIRLTRCSRCNALLREGAIPPGKDSRNDIVPEDMPLFYCPVCGRQYWE
ncbi:MAG: Mut7-C RNAse domain-containing protein, partial [Methanospirillum sp.]|nr:Mut7-C RNAse domain-containing protein [Methanospirillum sp.]